MLVARMIFLRPFSCALNTLCCSSKVTLECSGNTVKLNTEDTHNSVFHDIFYIIPYNVPTYCIYVMQYIHSNYSVHLRYVGALMISVYILATCGYSCRQVYSGRTEPITELHIYTYIYVYVDTHSMYVHTWTTCNN